MKTGLLVLLSSCFVVPCLAEPDLSVTNHLQLVGIRVNPFHLRIRNMMINDIGKTADGFTLVKYEPLSEEREVDGQKRKVDVSRLHLERDGKIFIVVNNQDAQLVEYTVRLAFTTTGLVYDLKKGSDFTVGDQQLTLVDIDPEHRQCSIVDRTSEERFTLDVITKKAQPPSAGDVLKAAPEK